MKKILFPILLMNLAVAYAADYYWAGVSAGGSGVNWGTLSNWNPVGTPASFDNAHFENFTANVIDGASQYGVNGLSEVNDLIINNLTIPTNSRFFIYTKDSAVINGDVIMGNVDTIDSGNEWRSTNIRGESEGKTLAILGAVTIAPTSTTTQKNASVLTFGGTNKSGFYKSLTIGENAEIDTATGYKTAVYLDATYAGARLELAGVNNIGDTSNWAVIKGVVKMNNSADGSKFASLMISRNELNPEMSSSYVSIGGISGTGRILTKIVNDGDKTGVSYLTFSNAEGVNTTFNGTIARVNSDYKDNVAFIMDGSGTQTLSLSGNTAGIVGVTIKNGTLYYSNSDSSGKLVMEGGKFGAVNGSAEFDSAVWSGGKISYANHEAFLGGTPEMIIINGEFEKALDGQIAIDFEGLDATALIGYSFDLISADSIKGFLDDANDDFVAENLKNALADFAWNGGTLQVTFTQVPEPAALAALIGAFALLFAIRRRRK